MRLDELPSTLFGSPGQVRRSIEYGLDFQYPHQMCVHLPVLGCAHGIGHVAGKGVAMLDAEF